MSIFAKLGSVFETKHKPIPAKRKAARKKRISPAGKEKSGYILEKSFLSKRAFKPEVTADTYTDSEWIFAAVSAISNGVSKIPIRLYKGQRNGMKTEVTEHLVLRVLNKPNPQQTLNDLRVFTQMNEELWGKSYWYLGRGGYTGIPKEIWPLTTSEVTPRVDANGDLISYYVSRFGYKAEIAPSEIIAFKQISPRSIHEGESAAKAAARSVQADSNTLKYVEAFFENSARPDFILSVAGISKEMADKLEDKWNNKHRGIEKSSKPSVIDGDLKLITLNGALKDLDITEQSRERRDRILAAFGVPKAVLGMVDDVNRASMEGSKLAFSEFVVDPRLQEFVEKLNTFFLPLFPNTDGLFFEADEHIPRDNELALREVESGLNSGYLTINEARAKKGMQPVKGGDEILLSWGKVTLDSILNPAELAPAKNFKTKDSDIDLEKGSKPDVLSEAAFLRVHGRNEKKFMGLVETLFQAQKRDVLGSLKKGMKKDALNPIDESKWLREFVEKSVPLYVVMVGEGGEFGAKQVAAVALREAGFTTRIPQILNQISLMATKFARHVNETTRDSLRSSLMEGLAAGESEANMADRVDEVFQTRVNNALTIARTETTKSVNFGMLESYRQNGLEKKEWQTVMDEQTRPAHAAVNGEVKRLDDFFVVGGEAMQFPSDPSASAGNTINCRCRLLPAI